MRQIVLDTETTGLEVSQGHRIIEIGAVELNQRQATGVKFHEYINPEREVEAGALEVHGISNEFLADKPRFADIATKFIEFIDGAELVIHNASFDLGFLNNELTLLAEEQPTIQSRCEILDTLVLAREMRPGQRNSLDALCKVYDIDNSSRSLHGALLDAQILADVYLAMTGGQTDLGLSISGQDSATDAVEVMSPEERGQIVVVRANHEELALHKQRLEYIDMISGENCLWKRG